MAEVNKELSELRCRIPVGRIAESVRDFARTDWQSVLHPNRNIILWQFAKDRALDAAMGSVTWCVSLLVEKRLTPSPVTGTAWVLLPHMVDKLL